MWPAKLIPLAVIFLDFVCGEVSYRCNQKHKQPFCLPESYNKQDRPNAYSDSNRRVDVSTGFIIDDVSDVDDDACAVTLVLIMKFSWTDERVVVDKQEFGARLKPGEAVLEAHYEGGDQLWTPDLYVSNMREMANTGFLDHPGVKIDVGIDKKIYYSRYAQVCLCTF